MSDLIDVLGNPIKPGDFVLLNRYWGDNFPLYVFSHKANSTYVFRNGYCSANIIDAIPYRFLLFDIDKVEEYIQNINKRVKGEWIYAREHHKKFLKEHFIKYRNQL